MLDLVPNRAVPIEGTKGVERKLVGGGGHRREKVSTREPYDKWDLWDSCDL